VRQLNNWKISVVGVIVIVCILETWFYLVNSAVRSPVFEEFRVNGKILDKSRILDPIYGEIEQPNSVIHYSYWFEGKKITTCDYFTDQLSRRITPAAKDMKRNKFALFFGCSYVWGWGLQQNETLPYYFSKYYEGYRPYNYAENAYGPQHMLANLQNRDIGKEIGEKDGIVIFLYMVDHINRLLLPLNAYLRGYNSLPYYTIDSDKKLVSKGLHSQRFMVKYIYSTVGKFQTMRYFCVKTKYTNYHTNDEELELFARVMAESRDLCKKKLGTDKFYVVFVNDPEPQLRARLDKYGVKSLYEKINGPVFPDGHPKAQYNEQLAQAIAKDLGLGEDFNR
jgi:hypothetical protein